MDMNVGQPSIDAVFRLVMFGEFFTLADLLSVAFVSTHLRFCVNHFSPKNISLDASTPVDVRRFWSIPNATQNVRSLKCNALDSGQCNMEYGSWLQKFVFASKDRFPNINHMALCLFTDQLDLIHHSLNTGFSHLGVLDLSNNHNITPTLISVLPPTLRSLQMGSSNFDDTMMITLLQQPFTRLQDLYLPLTEISCCGISLLVNTESTLKSTLRYLDISGVDYVTCQTRHTLLFSDFKMLTQLTWDFNESIELSPQSLQMPLSLRRLSLVHNAMISQSQWVACTETTPLLEQLHIAEFLMIQPDLLTQQLTKLTNLKILSFGAVREFGLPVLPCLRELTIFDMSIQDEDIASIFECGQLKKLFIVNCNNLSNGIATYLPHSLSLFSVCSSRRISGDLLEHIVQVYERDQTRCHNPRLRYPPTVMMRNCYLLPRQLFRFNEYFGQLGYQNTATARVCFDIQNGSSFDASGLRKIQRPSPDSAFGEYLDLLY